jgi:hypothetical protein
MVFPRRILDDERMRPIARLAPVRRAVRTLLFVGAVATAIASTQCSKTTQVVDTPDVCADNQFACEGQILKRCNANRSGFDTVDTCSPTARCDAPTGKCVSGIVVPEGDAGKTCVFDDPNSKFDDCTFAP